MTQFRAGQPYYAIITLDDIPGVQHLVVTEKPSYNQVQCADFVLYHIGGDVKVLKNRTGWVSKDADSFPLYSI
jgi:hypothetical protein